jgi:hypothetical protein
MCHLVWAVFFSAGSVINFTSQVRHHHIVRKKSILQAQKDFFTSLLQNAIAG